MAPSRTIQGLVNGGQARAVEGAKVYVLEASVAGYGTRSVSLLQSAVDNPSDSVGSYALTDRYGAFSIAGDYRCTAGREVYLYAQGGNSGGDGSNSAIGLMALLGTCPDTGSFDAKKPFVTVNAVTTVAAAYAMAGFASDATHVSDSANSASSTAAYLSSTVTGSVNLGLSAQPCGEEKRREIHTIANILSACINSDSPASFGCSTLFTHARSHGATGSVPGDTATAAINIARNPQANVEALYHLQPKVSAPFLPDLESTPKDFTLMPVAESPKASIASFLSNRKHQQQADIESAQTSGLATEN